jgi:uncharacterized lipoprotein YddW (UPF0748 family)
VDQVVGAAAEAGFNTLFVQVRGRGDAFYDSKIVNRSILLAGQPPSFDPLARVLEAAHARGMRVHAWVNVLLVGDFLGLPERHIVLSHPDWIMVPRQVARIAETSPPASIPPLVRQAGYSDPAVEGYYLSPSGNGVPEYLEQVVRELLRTQPVDGLHLDFIRYPNPGYDFSLASLRGFDPEGRDPLASALQNPGPYEEFLRDRLTSLATRLSRAARAERPGIVVSAAVVPDEGTAVNARYQDWPTWLARGLLDAVCPMAYTVDSRVFKSQIGQARTRAGTAGVWAGVGAYRLDFAGILEKVQLARDVGASGVILFSHESFTPWEWKALKRAFPTPGGEGTRLAPTQP